MAIDFKTPLGQVRLLTADTDETAFLLDDEHYSGYLHLNGQHVRRTAADVLEAMANTESLVQKKIRTQAGLTTDGPAVAADLRKQAATLRAMADAEEAAADTGGGGWELIPQVPYGALEGEEWRLP